MYQQLVTVRNAELQVLWSRYSIQTAINVGLLVGVLGRSKDSVLALGPAALIPSLGLALCLFWCYTSVYGGLWLRHWEAELSRYEAAHAGLEQLFTRATNSPPKGTWTQLYPAVLLPLFLGVVWVAYLWVLLVTGEVDAGRTPST